MKHGSLFSGIGGFDLAAEWMGWENVFQVEWDGFCQKVLAKNFPNTLRFGDIVEFNKMLQDEEIIQNAIISRCVLGKSEKERTDIREQRDVSTGNSNGVYFRERIGHIDIITGGFPCQPFSHAGKRKGTDDSRYLWPEMLTTIRIIKPAFVVGENVAGLISMENGKTLERILSDLENEGYQTESFIIPACAIGAWHRRDRIWIIGINTNTNPIGCNNGECSIKERSKRGGESFYRYEGLDKDVPNCDNQGLQGRKETGYIGGIREERNQQSKRYGECVGGAYWQSEPSVGRVANGIPGRMDRLKGLGNAIVPQVAYQIFKAIEETNKKMLK